MFRSTLIAAGAVALCGTGFAQEQLDPTRIHPITTPVRDAGVFNWNTKQWVSGPKAKQQLASAYTVFRNDCTWTGGGFYYGTPHCEDIIDNGRLPSATTPLSSLTGVGPDGVHIASGEVLSGATDDQIINNFQFAYCTAALTGTVDIKIGFYENLRGFCASGVPTSGKPFNLTLEQQAAPFGTLTAYFDFGAPSSFSLPGSTVFNTLSCWTVTITFPNNGGFCMASEGDGTWDNNGALDQFSWSFQHDNVNSTVPSGVIISGEPSTGGFGAGAYNIPVGSDAIFGGPCGTGFDNGDGWWINIDGGAPGVFNTTSGPGANCLEQSPGGTGCYWFGGWPGGPMGSFWMVMGSTGSCAGCSNRPETYCTAGTNANGCQALISASGSSSATAASGFFLNVTNLGGQKDGLFFFGTNGRQANGWGNGNSYQCVVPPVKRGGLLTGNGTNGLCDGSQSQDLNARWTAKPNSNPGAGAVVQGQFWYRDPGNTSNQSTSLSNAIEWTVCP